MEHLGSKGARLGEWGRFFISPKQTGTLGPRAWPWMSPFPLVSSRIMTTWKSKDKSFNKLWSWARVRKNYLRSEWQARESAPSSPAYRCPLSRGPRPRGEENTTLRGRPRPQGLEGALGARAEGEPEQPGRQVPQAGTRPSIPGGPT